MSLRADTSSILNLAGSREFRKDLCMRELKKTKIEYLRERKPLKSPIYRNNTLYLLISSNRQSVGVQLP